MNDKQRGGHGWLFPLIGIVLVSKAMRHHGRRHRAWLGGHGTEGEMAGGFRLPPKIESMLNAWHEQAHRATASAEAAEASTAEAPAA